MRITACLVAALCAAPAVNAQASIEWFLARRLTKADFQGRVPAGTPNAALSRGADRDLQEEQERYDRETSHGMNARAQEQWKRRIKALLN